jgi:ABC-type multidrug transport system, ATPase component
MLTVSNLSKKYGKVLAVDKVSFSVPSGQIGILLGPNGAGKSTIIKSVASLHKYEGTIEINGYPARELEAKKSFGYVPEIPNLYEALSVREHVEFIRRAYNSDVTDEEIEELFIRFELDDKADKLGNELSKGMMQKVSICCALAIKPKVIIFDEPMVGLDPAAIKTLKEVILELKARGITILLSTHMIEMVNELWDIVFIMEKGEIVASYRKEDVRDKNLDEIFFQVTEGGKK